MIDMTTAHVDARSALERHEDIFGPLNVIEYSTHFVASYSILVEMRGDGLRRIAAGYGSTETEAIDNLWSVLTDEDSFISIASDGWDYNYGWDGSTFVYLHDLHILDDGNPREVVRELQYYRNRSRKA